MAVAREGPFAPPRRFLSRPLSADDCEHVTGGQDQKVLAVELDVGAAVLGVDDAVALGYVHRNELTLLGALARADGENGALLGLLLGRVRDHDAGRSGLFAFLGTHQNSVLEW